jgi:hypothetical protein
MSLPDPPTADRWCSEDLLELYAGPVENGDPAIGWSTHTLQQRTTCEVEVGEDGLPVDYRFQQATAILAANLLVATPITADSGARVTGESIGGYSYQLAEPDDTTITEALDPAANPAVVDLIGWCLAGAAVAGGAYELQVGHRHGDEDWWEW